jgi:hypothetical protein
VAVEPSTVRSVVRTVGRISDIPNCFSRDQSVLSLTTISARLAIILQSGSGVGPFRAKGIGEPALTPAAPAVANAVADSLGVRIADLPITSEKVLRALGGLKDA